MASWVEPKTDWNGSSDERFEIEDYNRIIGNMKYLREFGEKLYSAPFFNSFEDPGNEKGYDCSWKAAEFNLIERDIEHLKAATYDYQTGTQQTFYTNAPFTLWSELNRIETAQMLIYTSLTVQYNSQPRMEYRFGTETDRFIQI